MEDFPLLEILLTAILSLIVSFFLLRKGRNYDIHATRINKIYDCYSDILNKMNEFSDYSNKIEDLNELSEEQQIEFIQREKEIDGYISMKYYLLKTLLDEKYQKVVDKMENKKREMNREFNESKGTEKGGRLFNEIRQSRLEVQIEVKRAINEQLQDFYRAGWFMNWRHWWRSRRS